MNPIPLSKAQEKSVKEWAADDRLWTTQEAVEFNLRTFARVVLKESESCLDARKYFKACNECKPVMCCSGRECGCQGMPVDFEPTEKCGDDCLINMHKQLIQHRAVIDAAAKELFNLATESEETLKACKENGDDEGRIEHRGQRDAYLNAIDILKRQALAAAKPLIT